MAAPSVKAGRMPCETCGDPAWVRSTSSGKLSYRCEACGSGHFAEKGDRAFRLWSKKMTPYADPDPEPAPAPAKPPAPGPAPAKTAGKAKAKAPAAPPPAGPFAGLLMD